MIGWNVYGLAEEPPFNALVICRWDQLVSMEPRLPKQGMDGTAESITWNLVSAIIGSAVRQCVPESEAMDTSASVATFLSSSLNPTWLYRAQKARLL